MQFRHTTIYLGTASRVEEFDLYLVHNLWRGITTFHEQGELRVLISNLLKAPKNSFRLTIDLPTPRRSVLVDEEKICL